MKIENKGAPLAIMGAWGRREDLLSLSYGQVVQAYNQSHCC